MGSEAPGYRLESRHWAVRVRCSGVPVSPEADPEGGCQGVLYRASVGGYKLGTRLKAKREVWRLKGGLPWPGARVLGCLPSEDSSTSHARDLQIIKKKKQVLGYTD